MNYKLKITNDMQTKEMEEQIVEYFRTNRENTIPAIARKFQVPKHKVNKIIDEYLKTKENERKNK